MITRCRRIIAIAVVAALVPGFGTARAQSSASAETLARAFGARPGIQQISVSPDGTKLAILGPMKARGSALLIADLTKGTEPTAVLASGGDPDRLASCHWSTNERLICTVAFYASLGGGRVTYSRVIAVDADGSNVKELSPKSKYGALGVALNGGELIDWGAGDGAALMSRTYVPQESTGTYLSSKKQGVGVDLVDTVTLKRKPVEQPRDGVIAYISDGRGTVRVMGLQVAGSTGYAGNTVLYSYRKLGSREWLPLSTVTIRGERSTGFTPVAVDPELNVAYGFEALGDHTGLYKVALDGSLTKIKVLDQPDVDIDDLIEIGRQNRVVGASFSREKREAQFFDPGLKALGTALNAAMPGRLVAFVDADSAENKLVVRAAADVDPGTYYFLDRPTRKMAAIAPVRPELNGIKLAPVKPITYQAADGTNIPAYLTLPIGGAGKNLPAIVMPHGGPWSRDEWGFDWLAQFFAARGFVVIQPNFRGSTGFGNAWYQNNGFKSWKVANGDVNDAGRWLIKAGIADPSKLAIVGWSYGGYAALQTSVLDPDLFKAIVAVAPVTDLEMLRNDAKDYLDYPQVDASIGKGPWVTEGSPARNAARIKAPVLLFHGDRDTNVGIGESQLMVDKIRDAGGKVELVEFAGLDHQLEDSDARAQLLAKADAFLRASMGMQP